MSDSSSRREKLQGAIIKITGCMCCCMCGCGVWVLLLWGFSLLISIFSGVLLAISNVLLIATYLCYWPTVALTVSLIGAIYKSVPKFQKAVKKCFRVCCLCTSEDVPSEETALVECPPPVQRDEETAVTIEFEEKGEPTAMLENLSPAQATPPPDKPETQGDLTTAAPPSYQAASNYQTASEDVLKNVSPPGYKPCPDSSTVYPPPIPSAANSSPPEDLP